MRILRRGGTAIMAAGLLALAACSGGGGGGTAEDSGPATIKLWLNGTDTPQELRDYLVSTFEAENKGSKLVIEQQDWNGLVPRLQTALTSSSQTPDLVEIGNTQSATFTYAGAFADISDMYQGLGGDQLLPGFVEAGRADGKLYAVPYYSGARAVFYRKDFFAAAGVQVPTTLAEFTQVAETLQAKNPSGKPNFSGFWFPGQDWYNGAAWIYTEGGDLAVKDGDSWKGTLESAKSQKGIAEVQELFQKATSAPKDADSADPWVPFNNGEAAMFSAPTWARWSIDLPECNQGVADGDKSPEAQAKLKQQQACNEEKTGVFPLPGLTADKPATVFAGGSNLAIPAKSTHQKLARNLLKIIFSEKFQNMLGQNGLIPGNRQYASSLGDDVYAKAALAAALDAKLTPAAEKWADVEGNRILEDFFQQIATGANPAEAAQKADKLISDTLNGKG